MPDLVTIRRSLKLAGQLAAVLLGAFVVVCFVIVLIMYEESHHFPVHRLFSMVLLTVGVFAGIVTEFRASWRATRFWVAVFTLFVFHGLAWLVAWRAEVEWRAITYGAIALVEIALLWIVLDTCGSSSVPRSTDTQRSRKRVTGDVDDHADQN